MISSIIKKIFIVYSLFEMVEKKKIIFFFPSHDPLSNSIFVSHL